MKPIKVLFGFDEPEFENGVIRYLKSLGYDVESTVKSAKTSVRDFLAGNPDYNVAVLLEVMNNSKAASVSKYTAEELALLTDERDMNIVVVVNENHRGTPYMASLYAAGITSAFYQKGRKGGASAKEIANLILNKRSRREARAYYGLGDAPIKVDFLGNDTFADYYGCLNDMQYGSTVIERFINICRYMSPSQVADFIRRMPLDVIEELKQYEEFFMILSMLKSTGINMNIKKPKNTCIGLATPDNMNLVKKQLIRKDVPEKDVPALVTKETSSATPVASVEQPAIPHYSQSMRDAGGTSLRQDLGGVNMADENSEQFFFELANSMWGDGEVTSSYNAPQDVSHIKSTMNMSVDQPDMRSMSSNPSEISPNLADRGTDQVDTEVDVDEFITKGRKKAKKKDRGTKQGTNKVLLISVAFIVLAILLIMIGIIVLLI